MSARGIITVDQLRGLVAEGAIDTVVNAICDMQGRLMGKRVTGDFFVEDCLDHGTHHPLRGFPASTCSAPRWRCRPPRAIA